MISEQRRVDELAHQRGCEGCSKGACHTLLRSNYIQHAMRVDYMPSPSVLDKKTTNFCRNLSFFCQETTKKIFLHFRWRELNSTPLRAQNLMVLALRAMLRRCRNARGSNRRRLAGEQALRLGFARLSAPPLAAQAATQAGTNLSHSAKKKDTGHPKGYPVSLSRDYKKDIFAFSVERVELSRTFFLDKKPDLLMCVYYTIITGDCQEKRSRFNRLYLRFRSSHLSCRCHMLGSIFRILRRRFCEESPRQTPKADR